ncbi:MAG: serine protease [Myxococcota bacterium]|nr:serine protease [Myxococcota bacterium]
MRVLVIAVALLGCKKSDEKPAPKPAEQPAKPAEPPVAVKPVGACENLDLVLASKILGDAAHPCRARLDAVYGRMISTGLAFSGTLVSTKPKRGAGFFITCQHCTGADGDGLREPEKEEPSAFNGLAPAQLAGTAVRSGPESRLYFIHRVFSRMPPKSAFDAKGRLTNIKPEDDFVVGTISGEPVDVVGHIGVLPSAKVSDKRLTVHDPRELLSQQPWAEAKPGTQALLLGFPRDMPAMTFGGELVASVGEILDDTRAKEMLLRADADEAAIPYDPSVELVVAARASSGMSGGGAFDEDGRYLGVSVRGTLNPVDGKYLVRVVRAPYVMKQLAAALAAAPAPLRTKLEPFLLP